MKSSTLDVPSVLFWPLGFGQEEKNLRKVTEELVLPSPTKNRKAFLECLRKKTKTIFIIFLKSRNEE